MSSLSAEFGPGIGCFATRLARTMLVASTRPLCSPEALAKLVVSTLVPLPFLRKEGATRTAAWLSKQSKQRSNRGLRSSEIEACRRRHLKRAGRNQCNRARRTRHPISEAAKGTKGYHCQTRLAVCRYQMPRILPPAQARRAGGIEKIAAPSSLRRAIDPGREIIRHGGSHP